VAAYQATSGPEPTQQFAGTTRALPTERLVTRAPVAQAPPAPPAVADSIPTSGGLLRSDDGENIEEFERSTALTATVNNCKCTICVLRYERSDKVCHCFIVFKTVAKLQLKFISFMKVEFKILPTKDATENISIAK